MQNDSGFCPVKNGLKDAMVKHVMPFAVVLSVGSVVGFLGMVRAFLDGEVVDAGITVSTYLRLRIHASADV